jgi:ketosteroid isomerase-like protein
MHIRSSAVALLLLVVACSPRLIPGTEARDTAENRAVLEVITGYASALQHKDAAAILALVAPDYLDNSGTPDPSDDLDRAGLEKALPADLSRVDGLRVNIAVKTIEVRGEIAWADLFSDDSYRVTTPAGAVAKRSSSVHRMKLRKVNGAWKILSGL